MNFNVLRNEQMTGGQTMINQIYFKCLEMNCLVFAIIVIKKAEIEKQLLNLIVFIFLNAESFCKEKSTGL